MTHLCENWWFPPLHAFFPKSNIPRPSGIPAYKITYFLRYYICIVSDILRTSRPICQPQSWIDYGCKWWSIIQWIFLDFFQDITTKNEFFLLCSKCSILWSHQAKPASSWWNLPVETPWICPKTWFWRGNLATNSILRRWRDTQIRVGDDWLARIRI